MSSTSTTAALTARLAAVALLPVRILRRRRKAAPARSEESLPWFAPHVHVDHCGGDGHDGEGGGKMTVLGFANGALPFITFLE